jgi:glycosyltransferase involved in cell wall biosynthesis
VGENQIGLLVDPEFPVEIAQAVDQLVSDPGMYRRMSQKGPWFVENVYN